MNRHPKRSPWTIVAAVGATASVIAIAQTVAPETNTPVPLEIASSVEVGGDAIRESSGLAVSARDPTCLWTHNDSGAGPIVHAIETATGNPTGQWLLDGVTPVDWEDMAMIFSVGQARLVIADVGDNRSERPSVRLHIFDEPNPRASGTIANSDVQTIRVRYPDGAADCEAVWFDPDANAVMLLTKRFGLLGTLYRVPLSPTTHDSNRDDAVTAIPVASIPTPLATGADRDRQTGDVWVTSYWNAWRFPHGDWSTLPETFRLPPWKQIESIALDDQSRVWISTEGSPCRVGRLKRTNGSAPDLPASHSQ